MSQKIRTLVADDEPIARARVVALLRGEADIELVRECATGAEARAAIRNGYPIAVCSSQGFTRTRDCLLYTSRCV